MSDPLYQFNLLSGLILMENYDNSFSKPCLVHGSMIRLLGTEIPALPITLLPNETVSLMYNLHLTSSVDYLAKEVRNIGGKYQHYP